MKHFEKLHKVLHKELRQQEKLLELLTRERAAIARMNREAIEMLTSEKATVISAACLLENDRESLVASITEDAGLDTAPAFKDLITHCEDVQLKKSLVGVAGELRKTAVTVQDLNDHNAVLIKQTLGIVVSTIAIFRSAAGAELPTYGRAGALNEGNAKSPAPRTGHVRQA